MKMKNMLKREPTALITYYSHCHLSVKEKLIIFEGLVYDVGTIEVR